MQYGRVAPNGSRQRIQALNIANYERIQQPNCSTRTSTKSAKTCRMNPSAANLKRPFVTTTLLLVVMVAMCGCSSQKLLDKQIAEEKRAPQEVWQPSIDYLKGTEQTLAPGSADVYRLLEGKKYKKAHELTSQMLESDLASPEEKAEYYLFRGVTNRLMVKEKAGFDDLNLSIELNPNDWRAYKARHELYENRSMHENAKADWEKARELNPQLPLYQFPGGVI